MVENPLSRNKLFLFLSEFIVGVSLMGVEIAANRLFVPYVSGTQVVLTIVTVTVMLGMALGNFVGGRLSEKKNAQNRLYILLTAAGLWVILTAFVGRYVIAGLAAVFALFVNAGLIVFVTVFSSLFLLLPPMLIFGMVTPNLVKFAVGEGKFSGKIVGVIEACNTIGSVLGTLLPTFVTIPFMGTPMSFFFFGIILVLLGLSYLLTGVINNMRLKKQEAGEGEEKSSKKGVVGTMTFAALSFALLVVAGVWNSGARFTFWDDKKIIYEGESMYNYLKVTEDGSKRYFSTNVMFGVQSTYDKNGGLTDMYYDYSMMGAFMAKQKKANGPLDVLVLGNATGTHARLLKSERYFPYETNITGVEIDEKIIELGYQYFDCPRDMKVVADDGRSYLEKQKGTYDLIFIDAYSSIAAPFQMTTVEFFSSVYSHLNPNGVMVMNVNMYSKERGSMNELLTDTVSSVFDSVQTYRLKSGTNLELFATKEANMTIWMKDSLSLVSDPTLSLRCGDVASTSIIPTDHGARLTDSSGDVELSALSAVDGLIFVELDGYRRAFQDGGLPGLFRYLFG
ncbi:MAG: spermidine synthase [Erysipelotrichaceae bacterium]|nr:spermidine synthase [Erysipelotrichaceae bacterium]